MSGLQGRDPRGGPARSLLRHRWQRALGWATGVGLGLILLSMIRPPAVATATGGLGGTQARPPVEVEPWRQWRARLAVGHGARRAGDVRRALEVYDAVASAVRARGQDAEHAALWAARLRLGLGECSASLALRAVVRDCADPALLARAMVEARSHASMERCAEWSSILRATAALARTKLNALAEQETGEGARARRWLRSSSVMRR